MLMFGLVDLIHRRALMSDIPDRAGLALSFFTAHLILNGAWIMSMTKKILTGVPLSPGCEV
jgi:hypothetical protein